MTAADLVSQGYRKYIGWGDAEANADFNAVHPSKDPGYGGASGSASGPSPDDIVNTAKKLNDFQIQANQPAIATLQGQQAPLEQRYQDLLSNIKGQKQVADNSATLNFNNEMGKRGISSDSGLYQKDLTNTLLPTDVAYGGLLNQADTAHSGDVNTLANQIASLQAGNPESSISGGLQLGNVQQSASQFSQQLAQALNLATNTSIPSNVLALAQARYLGGQTQSGVSALAQQFGL